MEHYQSSIPLDATKEAIFNALTQHIPQWWSMQYEGSAQHTGDTFTVRFGDLVHKTIKVTALETDTKVVWYVEDSLIAIPELHNQTEWIATTIHWDITETKNGVFLNLTHVGLHPAIECYDICSNGWQQFTNSLKSFAETGVGTPFQP